MLTVLQIGLSNAAMATLLALLAASVGRVCRRPALAHGMWLLVLLKLITPPLLPFSIAWPAAAELATTESEHPAALPVPDTNSCQETLPVAILDPAAPQTTVRGHRQQLVQQPEQPEAGVEAASAVEPAGLPSLSSVPWVTVLASLWLAGSALRFLAAGLSIYRFRQVLRCAYPAPAEVHEQAATLAQRLGLARCPAILLLPGAVSPMLWAIGNRACLLLPSDLLGQLTGQQQATLLAHELAHVRRRDHWVRVLELVVTGLYWWYPLVWWARRQIRAAEEQCCDAWVLWALPGAAPAYANALLETVDFLSQTRPALPAAASGIGQVRLLRRRLIMIMRGTPPKALSRAGLLATLGLGAVLLPLVPTWGKTSEAAGDDEAQPAPSAGQSAQDIKHRELRKATFEVLQLKGQVDEQKANLKSAEAALKRAEASLQQAVERLRRLENQAGEDKSQHQGGRGTGQGKRSIGEEEEEPVRRKARLPIKVADEDEPTKIQGRLPLQEEKLLQESRISADRLADLEKQIDALRHELQLLRHQSGRSSSRPADFARANQALEDADFAVKLVRVFSGHGLAVSSVAWSPDGKTVVSGSYDTTVRLWDAATGKERRRLVGHDARVQSVAFSPDGRYILSGGYDGAVLLWDAAGGKEIRRLERGVHGAEDIYNSADGKKQIQQPTRIKSVLFSPDGRHVLAGGEDGNVNMWDVATGKEVRHFGGSAPVQTIAISPDGKLVAAGCFDNSVHLWDVTGKRGEARQSTHTAGWILRVAFSPDGRRLAVSSANGIITLWDTLEPNELAALQGHRDKVECLAFSPDGRRLLSASFDSTIGVWDVATGRLVAKLGGHKGPVLTVAFSPDGKLILSGGDDGTIRLWSSFR